MTEFIELVKKLRLSLGQWMRPPYARICFRNELPCLVPVGGQIRSAEASLYPRGTGGT